MYQPQWSFRHSPPESILILLRRRVLLWRRIATVLLRWWIAWVLIVISLARIVRHLAKELLPE